MRQFFCIYCVPDTAGNHELACLLHDAQKERKKDGIVDRFGDILKKASKITGQNKDIGIDELIEELKKK